MKVAVFFPLGAIALLLMFGLPAPSSAQFSMARISGRVVDPAGGVFAWRHRHSEDWQSAKEADVRRRWNL